MPRGRFFAALVVLSMLAVACQPSASGSPAESTSGSEAPAGSYLERAEAGEFDGTTVLVEGPVDRRRGENFAATSPTSRSEPASTSSTRA